MPKKKKLSVDVKGIIKTTNITKKTTSTKQFKDLFQEVKNSKEPTKSKQTIESTKSIEPTKFIEPTQHKEIPKKYFLFKCGPTGSGKSSMEKIIDTYLKTKKEFTTSVFDHKKTANLSIDDLVERNPYFKERVDMVFDRLFKKYKQRVISEIKPELLFKMKDMDRKEKLKSINSIADGRVAKIIIDLFDNPEQALIDELNVIYENARIRTSCLQGDRNRRVTRRNVANIRDSCENIRDELLTQALAENKHIVYERVGKDFPTKLFTKFPKIQEEYTIIFCWSVVNICELLHRNRERVIKKLEQYFEIKDKSPIKFSSREHFLNSEILPIPRLPDTNEIKYKKTVLDIITIFNIYFYGKNNYRQLVIDNNFNGKIVYDNKYNNTTKKGNPMSRYNVDQAC